jgi:hypothetical protein
MSFPLSSQINDLHQQPLIWAPHTGRVDDNFLGHQLIGSQKVHSWLFAPRKTKNVIFAFLTKIADISRKSWQAFRSMETEKRGFRFPHGSMIRRSIIDPGAFPRRVGH